MAGFFETGGASNMSIKLMTHMVAGYPDFPTSLKIAEALVKGGADILEVQFPFSDPTADGIYIQQACTEALDNGFKTNSGFALINKIRELTTTPIFIMSYANPVFMRSIKIFLRNSLLSGAQGVIIPDLPVDYDEGLYYTGKILGISVIPVITPATNQNRLRLIFSKKPDYVYTTLRKGITGSYTEIDENNLAFLGMLSKYNVKILAGFGISNRLQINALKNHVYAAVIGSAFIKEILQNKNRDPSKVVLRKIKTFSII